MGADICPKCKTNLKEEIDQFFKYHHANIFFDLVCPKCKVEMEVCVESIPPFECYLRPDKTDNPSYARLLL